ncbi:hypothetical protein C1H46_038222 [Malus baccata]|uniref:ATP synthase F1 complex delta/epsilon subunit N-terminal domain-containing protein n=1 Tax=Malus baccata TaxID=106549 RepID=A0A540KPT4_MALBA|nr:hypothetical protein C1H46_038222 [Malus baccata]
MFRQASRLLGRSSQPPRVRAMCTEVPANSNKDSAFVEAWKKVSPTMEPPHTPSTYMEPRPPTPSSLPSKLTVNFVLPYSSQLSGKEIAMLNHIDACFIGFQPQFINKLKNVCQVDMVMVPATTGQMGVLPGHVPTIAELKPGVLSVHEGSDVTKYFVSSGFAFIHANSVADIVAVEAVPIDQIDASLVQKGLAEFTQKLSSATTDLEKAEAQIGVDVHSALNSAITG